ncbi:C5a anaphylatoxin chemotactic receptor 1-like [Bombina bombina]|uniref:C5a anaphylatoxin chemotactic receptor 1-like n=1 Tax=Bombina bombina TaxID=8345 RepID=UPI00235B015A|nr:C5a anaphylatoxin chemotactic receptor 1-like [Bombina bombina]
MDLPIYNYDDFENNFTDYNYSFYHVDELYPNIEQPIPPLSPVKVTALIIYVLVFLLGLPGNALVIWITAYKMKRTVSTMWFLNLAIADLLCCLSVPFSVMGIILRGHWPLGLFACKFIASVLLVNMYASVLILAVISMDRCVLVIKPVWRETYRLVKNATLVCLMVWILACVLASPSFIFRRTIVRSHNKITCSMDYSLTGEDQAKVEMLIAVFRFMLGFVIPFLFITVCYGVLVSGVNLKHSQSSKILRIIVDVIIVFFVCWFPYHVAGLILAAHPSHSDLYTSTIKVDSILISIAFTNSCINPIIYVLLGQDVKNKLKKSVKLVIQETLQLADELSKSLDSKNSKSTSETKNMDTQV